MIPVNIKEFAEIWLHCLDDGHTDIDTLAIHIPENSKPQRESGNASIAGLPAYCPYRARPANYTNGRESN